MTVGDLITAKDWQMVQNHMKRLSPLSFSRSAGKSTVVITLEAVKSPVWASQMAVTVRLDRGGLGMMLQHFESVAEARKETESWVLK